ncbi:SUMF1/EgtB/PvdO family nonheme iron enzyme [Fibrobacter sp.]|uniref:formylglycine-generating enzyme family protein n=1 Tax=Fibrobacter sp. TaxID=35828 RepID=UPI002612D15E|nr:SUMF1/EgtB/PvdO family nonheme iron enzyme [Fibrobacter sp.]MDD5941376.1 SUMF1/EgtB/PvdO family nonheme iron enzyme [Fibrobacter sp.]
MHKISSGVIAVTFIAGMFVGCSESPESGLTPLAEGDSSATIPPDSSNADSLQGISSGAVVDDSSTYSSSGFLTASSSDNVLAISSSSDELATHSCSSSGTEFSYIAPANFTDTVNGVLFDMIHIPGGSYTRGCDNCEEQDKIYETPAHKVTVSDYIAAKTEVTVSQWNAAMGGNSWEWVYDWLVGYTAGDKVNPVQLTGSGNKTRRGGSYGEPAEFARVSRRAIRSRDGAADMGFRLGASTELPPGMISACEAANPSDAVCVGDKNRDCRLITAADEAWISDDYTVVIGEDGIAAVSGFPNVSGQWYTLNNRSFNVVTKTGTKTYAYYVFSQDELTMISDDGIPYRLYRRVASEAKNKVSLTTVSNPKTLEQLIAAVEPERLVTDEQLAHPDTSVRDPRIAAASGYTWFFDGRCCGGNHKYRFHLDKNGDAEFVVMDYDDTHHENILAKGRWFTVGNIGLHIVLNGKYFNYLYTAGERTMSYSEYMPAGPIFCHISFQSYERGDFRIFNKTLYDDKIKRPRGFNGENPVYEPGDYQWGS